MENKIEEYAGFIIAFCIFTFLVGITFYVVKQFYPQESHLSIMSCVVLFWTMVTVIWYSWETSRLRKVGQQQIEVQQRPFVVLEIGNFYTKDLLIKYSFRMRNVGVSTAINVRVMDVFPEGSDYGYRFFTGLQGPQDSIPVLAAQGVEYVYPKRIIREDKPVVTESIQEDLESLEFICRVQFHNIEMTSYFILQKASQGQIEILDSGPINKNA